MNDVKQNAGESGTIDEMMAGWKDELARTVSRILAGVGVLALLALAYLAGDKKQWWYMAIYVPVYLFVLAISLLPRIHYRVRILTVIGIGIFFALITMAIFGINAESAYMLLMLVILSTLFEGYRGGYLMTGLCMLGLIVLAWLFVSGRLVVQPNYTIRNADPVDWLLTILFFATAAIGMLWALGFILSRLRLLGERHRQTARELDRKQADLERQIAERVAEADRHRTHLETIVQVARELVMIQELDPLLSRAVSLIRKRFDQAFVAISLLDESGEFLILHAVDGVEELPTPEPGHQVRVAEAGVAGEVVELVQARVLPPDAAGLTGRRVLLPLIVRGKAIGLLEVQGHVRHTSEKTWDEQDLIGWQMLADRLAAAIDNARLRMRLEQSLLSERQAYATLTREGWQRLLSARPDLGFVRNRRGILPLDKRRLAGEAVWPEEKPLVQASALTLPIRVRNQVIGRLDARKPDGSTWLPQEVELLETLTRELNDALENARLYQDTQRREAEQRLIGEVAAEVRRTLDVDTVLQTAIREIGKALSLSQVEVRLRGATVAMSDDLMQTGEEHS